VLNGYYAIMSDQLKIALVKQNSCYDLYTQSGPDVRSILESSNMRTGAIGLWQAFDCSFKIVLDSPEKECQLGQRLWNKYVQGWSYKRSLSPESPDDIDWSLYDIVISVDVAIPSRIVRKFPKVMWCYYIIELGPSRIPNICRGGPLFGYNVFLNQRLSKTELSAKSSEALSMFNTRRAILDFPYYILSSKTIQELYSKSAIGKRDGIMLSHYSYSVISESEEAVLSEFGELYGNYATIGDIHKLELKSKYFVVHPQCKGMAGVALIEAISAGCLVIAPRRLIFAFSELISHSYNYKTFTEMIEILRFFESDSSAYDRERKVQSSKIDKWCYTNPINNIACLYNSFRASNCSLQKQYIYENINYVPATLEKIILAVIRMVTQSCCHWSK